MNGQARWWHFLIIVLMVLIFGLVGEQDYQDMKRAEALRGAVYVTGW